MTDLHCVAETNTTLLKQNLIELKKIRKPKRIARTLDMGPNVRTLVRDRGKQRGDVC